MTIGIIDTGVDFKHRRLKSTSIEGITIYQKNNTICIKEGFPDQQGHGTGICAIINAHVKEVKFSIVKLANHNKNPSEKLLTEAINHLVSKKAKIINISMGIKTIKPTIDLKIAVENALNEGTIIVASSYYDSNYACYPADFNTVLSVGSGYIKSSNEFKYLKNRKSNILAKGGFQRIAIPNDKFRFGTGTSLATAHFTGIIAKSYQDNKWKGYQSLLKWLEKNSNDSIFSLTRHDTSTSNILRLDKKTSVPQLNSRMNILKRIKQIALFPFEEKEMKSIYENIDFCPFNLTLLIGYPRTIKIDDALLHSQVSFNFVNKDLTEEQYNLFDTIVIGYFTDQQSDFNTIYGLNLIKNCVQRNKNFILWDRSVYDIVKKIARKNNLYNANIHLVSFGVQDKKTFESVDTSFQDTKPSICVIGTSKKQGKFTAQLTLKKILSEYGYNVAHIATEPQGILLGADQVFPIGHKSTVSISVEDWYRTINIFKRLIIEKNNPDIIISGSQSGILLKQPIYSPIPPEKLIFVNAFYPDAIVCAISPNDDLDYIKRTVNTVKSFNNCTLLFYCLTPYVISVKDNDGVMRLSERILERDEYNEKLAYYRENLSLPVFNILDIRNHREILTIIQNFFKKK